MAERRFPIEITHPTTWVVARRAQSFIDANTNVRIFFDTFKTNAPRVVVQGSVAVELHSKLGDV